MNALQTPSLVGEIMTPRTMGVVVAIDEETNGVLLQLRGLGEIVMPREDARKLAEALLCAAGSPFHRGFVQPGRPR